MMRSLGRAALCRAILSFFLVVLAGIAQPGRQIAAAAEAEPPALAAAVANRTLPPMDQRLPQTPLKVPFDALGLEVGRYGGDLRTLVGVTKDTRMMVVYGYARLIGYDTTWALKPDILERYEVEDNRVFTFHLRKGHKWSDGHPYTTEDFRFFWEDVANNPELSPSGPPQFMLAGGKPPRVEIIDETTVRYTWDAPNFDFLPALAGSRPEYIYLPAHYLKAFHVRYAEGRALDEQVRAAGQRDWTALFYNKGRPYQNDNPDLPSLEPWVLQTPPPSSRFVFVRNPYFHRVDPEGRQLPYIDQVSFSVVNASLIPVKTASGDADLQARGLSFQNIAVLKQGQQRNNFDVRLWTSARGSELALFPNLNVDDPTWRALMRETNFRRALSLAIDRDEVSQVIYFGLAKGAQDTVLPESPLYKPAYAEAWTDYDIAEANRLLDGLGLKRDGGNGPRRLADGRTMDLVVETAGEDQTQVDVLQLLHDSWAKIGINLLIKPEQRDLFRNRVFSGATQMSVWTGLENALPAADTVPRELAPTDQQQLSWPKWGQYVETDGRSGEPIDLPAANALARLYTDWEAAADEEARAAIWHEMLQIRADELFSIGVVRAVPQPVVVAHRLRNVPQDGVYNWEPGAYFGVYHPDAFWLAGAEDRSAKR
ncbi:MAG: ABC transporter substrate-binding protein [Rhodospirillales bacterium]|nr:ABC transporter substrate-binding protein [Rhodospirillales bacterium]